MSEVFDMINEEAGGKKLNLFQQTIEDIGLDKINILQLDENKDYMDRDTLRRLVRAYSDSQRWNERYYKHIRKGRSHSEAISRFPAHIRDEVEAYVKNPVKKPELTSDLDRKIWELYTTEEGFDDMVNESYADVNQQIWNLKKMADEHVGGDKKSPKYPGDTSLHRQVRFSKIVDDVYDRYESEKEDERPVPKQSNRPEQSSRGITERIFKKLLGM